MKMTREEVLATAKINPEMSEIMERLGPLRGLGHFDDLQAARSAVDMFKTQMIQRTMAACKGREPPPTWSEEDIQIPIRDGASIELRIHKPLALPDDGCPILVVVHGGGFCFGDLDYEEILCKSFVALGGIAVNVGFRLAPENPFPNPVLDVYDAMKWTATHFEELGGNPKKGFIAGGVSTGAHLVSIASMLYLEGKHTPRLTGSYLSIPICIPRDLLPSKFEDVWLCKEQNQDAPILTRGTMEQMDAFYGLDRDPSSRLRSPLMFPSLLKEVPPTYFQVCGLDPTRDEGLIYERILSEDYEVKTKLDLYPGLPHEFWRWFPDESFSVKQAKDSAMGLKWLLEQSS